MAESDESDQPRGEKGAERPLSDSLREAVEGAFAATGLTRDRAQDLTGKTRDRAQELVGEVSRMGQDAREAIEGLRLIGRDEYERLVERVDRLEEGLAGLERELRKNRNGD